MKLEHFQLLEAQKRKNIDLQKEYDEIQKLHGERPSRPDDIRHIKTLLKDIENMKLNVAEAEQKVVHANGTWRISIVFDSFLAFSIFLLSIQTCFEIATHRRKKNNHFFSSPPLEIVKYL